MPRILATLFALVMIAGGAAGADIQDKFVNVPSVDAWNAIGAKFESRDDAGIPGGKSVRIAVPSKGANPWDVQATTATTKPIKKGDVVLVAFWVRAENPPEGQATVDLPIRFQLSAAPYTSLIEDHAAVGPKWVMVYASGVIDRDCAPGSAAVTLHLAGAKQTIDLGQVMILDFGPDYDRTKLPRNPLPKAAAAPAAPPPAAFASAETRFADELAKLRKQLPVRGQLLNDPSVAATSAYGTGQTSQIIAAPDVVGGQALRVSITKPTDAYLIGTGSPLYGDIRKGDVVLLAFYARAASNDGQPGVISAYNVQQSSSPWTVIVSTSAQAPLNSWRLFYAAGVASQDYPSGGANLTAQIGSRTQTIDFGPAFVLNLGPGVKLSALPSSRP